MESGKSLVAGYLNKIIYTHKHGKKQMNSDTWKSSYFLSTIWLPCG